MKPGRNFILLPALALLLALFVCAGAQQPATSRVHITIIGTADLHGNILPIDYYTHKPDARGLAKAATIIKQARRGKPKILLPGFRETNPGKPPPVFPQKKKKQPPQSD